MKIQNPFIIGLATTMFVLGMVLPASAELFPQQATSIIDWEDEFVGSASTQASKAEGTMQDPGPSPINSCSSLPVVLDWEDEFICASYSASPSDAQPRLQSKNAASWSFEDWQSM